MMTKDKKKAVLGRGLSALLQSSETDITSKYEENKFSEAVGSVASIDITKIEANPFQPRTHFDETALKELTESIIEHGIIQPLTVRKIGNNKFQLISGERRFRASQIAGLKEVPVYIRIANDQGMLEMAIIENIQRENLDAIEVAIGYKRLIDECNLTQEALGERVGKDRSTVTNYLRLLKLPAEIQLGIREKKITMGHARAVLPITDDRKLIQVYKSIVDGDLSVRATETLVKQVMAGGSTKPAIPAKSVLNTEDQRFRSELEIKFRTKVAMTKDENGGGKIVINFKNEDDLERIVKILSV
ncbi:MAG TPA: ParB/RepB/Spo0J family partition protein [Flavobacteriales bacterium]|nr:ParB/RepB/Spo0J family partition protein [Flavobacteriales bacterium]